MITKIKQKISFLKHKHEAKLDVLFFIGGFAFDAIMVSEVDEPLAIAQQALYLFLIATLIHFEMLFRLHKWRPGDRLMKLWNYRNLLLHFLLGTLLNIYSIFYIKSASFINSLIFLFLMAAMILANELPLIKKSKVSFKVGLFAICLFSYVSILYPLILGFIGWIPFLLATITTLLIFYFQFKILQRSIGDLNLLLRATLLPSVSVVLVFSFFYVMGWIPPVPLSVKEQGIYHLIEKKDGQYLLSTERPDWKFWESGDQQFKAVSGDKIYFYAQIYSPARFSDEVFVQFSHLDAKNNWRPADRIPMTVHGGRKEGFRGFAVKSNYEPGEWRVQVMTEAHQEISRLSFEVIPTESNPNRQFKVIAR
jgi:hypothetical protein